MNYHLGIDFGTSGARAIAINQAKTIISQVKYPFSNSTSDNLADTWQRAIYFLLEQIPIKVRKHIRAIAINGTSSTVLLCDRSGTPLDNPILYNDARGAAVLEQIRNIAPAHHVVISATSSLAKLLWWQKQAVFSQKA